MKQTTKNWFGAALLVLGSSAVTGAVVRGTASNSQPLNPEPVATMPAVAAPVGGYVDLTTAAESAVGSVVYIKVTQTGKTQRIQMQDRSKTSLATSSALAVETVSHSNASTSNPTVMLQVVA